MRFEILATLLLCGTQALATFDIGYQDDSDLTKFVSRPEIRAPLFNVTFHKATDITKGYWFLAPYVFIDQEPHAQRYYQPCQTGPAIYDGDGELVWSGACQVRNQNTCDWRLWNFNNTQYLSAILTQYKGGHDPKGHGFIMNSSFEIEQEIHTTTTINSFNMHELNLIENGTKALYLVFDPTRLDLTDLQDANPDLESNVGWVADMGFREVDLSTGQIEFEWWAARSRHVSLAESQKPIDHLNGPYPKAWNWFHGNSIEKNAEGDYMLSSRFTNTIFKISGEDGHIIWRLGGMHSSFDEDFNFSRQHDARWLSISPEIEVITFLNNAADETSNSSTVSSALIVELDRDLTSAHHPRARVINRIDRPDGNLTRLRGNYQTLSNGNHFICWSENSYISEHSADGQPLFEARFSSKRFVTYRAYKFNFTGDPSEPPAVVASAYGTSPSRATTVIHVSWNGATEVEKWVFRAGNVELGSKNKTSFETSFQVDGFHPAITVEAINANGERIGVSPVVHIDAPADWDLLSAHAPQALVAEDKDDRHQIVSIKTTELITEADAVSRQSARVVFERISDVEGLTYCGLAICLFAFAMRIGLFRTAISFFRKAVR